MKPLKLLYVVGTGDIAQVYEDWLRYQDDREYFGCCYLVQFLNACQALGCSSHVISLSPKPVDRPRILKHHGMILEYRPDPRHIGGIFYHFAYIGYISRLIFTAIRSKTDVVIVSYGSLYWFLLSILPLFGIRVLTSMHNVLWPKFKPIRLSHRILYRLTSHFFQHSCFEIHVTSKDIEEQIQQLTGYQSKPIVNFLPLYKREQFLNVVPPEPTKRPFRILFAGRIEVNKGIYILLQLADRLRKTGRRDIVFDICGEGSYLAQFKQDVEAQELDSYLILHGFCAKDKLSEMYNRSHVVIVPTTHDFIEGFNMVMAEGVLTGRPVIASDVCPALAYVYDATIPVANDDVDSYYQAILTLCDNALVYRQKRKAALASREQFFDISNSWEHQLKKALVKISDLCAA